VFFPFEQDVSRGLAFTIKTRSDPAAVLNGLRRSIAGIDPQLPVFRPRSMQEWIDLALVGRRVPAFIAMAFAIAALFLSAVGVYGVLAYSVALRQRDFGVRMALGGTSGDIFGLVLRGGLRIVAAGVAAGLVVAFFVGRLMHAQLFNVQPLDPIVMLAGTMVLTLVALIASVVPAWRASRISPNVALSR
jgi:ABC-type antimicrobial peptide transport system permease subunit